VGAMAVLSVGYEMFLAWLRGDDGCQSGDLTVAEGTHETEKTS
jgi:hypothetical protein